MKSFAEIEAQMRKLGYRFFTSGDYNLNIIGIRNKTLNTNTFNDEIHIIYKVNGKWVDDRYPITTEPGYRLLKTPLNNKGCAILVPGQYNSCYQLGLHKGQYTALVQRGLVRVYRDNNRDQIVDLNPKTIDEGYFGINIHKAGVDSKIVDNWSGGCQVFKRKSDFDKFIAVCKKSSANYGNKFTYTLLNDW